MVETAAFQRGEIGPFYPRSISADEESHLRKKLAVLGIRLLPFPFGSAISIVSDVDGSRRSRYDAYVRQLVHQLGFDFGDSTWLRWTLPAGGSGFLSPNLTLGRDETTDTYNTTRTFCELVNEYHTGNIDHFHAFQSKGPRVAIITPTATTYSREIELPICETQNKGTWQCSDFFVFGICVVGKTGTSLSIESVKIVDRNGNICDAYRSARFNAPPDGRHYKLFNLKGDPDDGLKAPQLEKVKSVVLTFSVLESSNSIERVLLTSLDRDVLLGRLGFLRDKYNIEIQLVTEHSALAFRNPDKRRDEALKQHVATYAGPIEAYNGTLVDDEGNLVFSTDTDEPHSLCRVFPELSDDLEVRFIVPHPATQSTGWSPLQVISPSPTRLGTAIYWANRVLPNIKEPPKGYRFDGHSRHDTFGERLMSVLKQISDTPGLCWPIYTHLGGTGDAIEPQPYLPLQPLLDLQDRVLNISSATSPQGRIWFARATILYDYALMIRSIANAIDRPTTNSIHIDSWVDPVLGVVMPRSPAQLFGVTFYVDNPSEGEVILDGKKIESLVRNPPDGTGRASVTIVESDAGQIIFDELDPTLNDSVLPVGGNWQWLTLTEPPAQTFGRLMITDGDEKATLEIPLHGFCASGSQVLEAGIRSNDGSRFALILKTESGAHFFFGERELAGRIQSNVLGSYYYVQSVAREDWNTFCVPFYDLHWASHAEAGGPLPTHALDSLTIVCEGRPGSAIDVRKIAFLRPRTFSRARTVKLRFTASGCVPDSGGGELVYAISRSNVASKTMTDQRGFFTFRELSRGVYRMWAETPGGSLCDRRGPQVEISNDVVGLVLNRPCSTATVL